MVVILKKESEKYVENAKMAKGMYPGAAVMDVTIDGLMGNLDPAFRWEEGVAVPGTFKERGLSLKGVWEGLKIFERKGVDKRWWSDEKYVGKERKCKVYGELKGFGIGEKSVEPEEGKEIFERIYKEEVEKRFGDFLEVLRKESKKRVVVLLDYKEGDGRKMINHVEILKEMIEKE